MESWVVATIAIYNSKGGVGKTTLAINLAWEAVNAGYRVLLWEIDEQGDSSWMMSAKTLSQCSYMARSIEGTSTVSQYIVPTTIPNLSLLAADSDARRTDNFFVAFARGQRLTRLFAELEAEYDVIILDCPPGFSDTNRKILLFVNLVIVPVIPSPFAFRGMVRIRDFMIKHRGHHPPILPVFTMVDRRRGLHKAALAENSDWPIIPMSSDVERMAAQKLPVAVFAPTSESTRAVNALWNGVAQKLRKMVVLRNCTCPRA